MPTGYTACVQDGNVTELKDYILRCSRKFGALIHMRDDALNTSIKHREVSDYRLNRLNEIKKDFEEFKKLSDEEIQKMLDESYLQKIEQQKKGLKEFEIGKQRYLDMLEKVKEWQPPSDDHMNLKNFAIEQLEGSLDFDYSDTSKEYYLREPFKDSVEQYRQFKIESYIKDIKYHSDEYKKEAENVEKINKWIDDLVNSFI